MSYLKLTLTKHFFYKITYQKGLIMKKILFILFFAFGFVFAFEELKTEDYKQKIENKNVILDFHPVYWCACKILGKNLTKYSTSNKPNDVEIYKVDIQKEPEIAKKYKVSAVPMLVYIKNNKVVKKELWTPKMFRTSPRTFVKPVTVYCASWSSNKEPSLAWSHIYKL